MNIQRAKGHGKYATVEVSAPEFSRSWHIKFRPETFTEQQQAEASRINWLGGRLLAPPRARALHVPGLSALITPTVEGTPSHECIDRFAPSNVLAGLVSAIKLIQSIDDIEFSFSQPDWVTEAGIAKNLERMRTSKSKHRELHPDFAARTYSELKNIVDSGSNNTRKVLVHGDLCMPNVLLGGDGDLSAIVDFGDLHIGDPDLDLAIASWTVRANMGSRWENDLLSQHGTGATAKNIVFNRLAYDLGLERPSPWSWIDSTQLIEQRERLAG